eukprot:INCI14550.2.p1 GENE.INCI14550.2~~INCI14550.2.p1  ORF type:complete len:1278 (-),score=175.31 INCI14550.2:2597-6430(-)
MDFPGAAATPAWAASAQSLAKTSVSSRLKEQAPDMEQAAVVFAAVVNEVCGVFLSAAVAELKSYLTTQLQLAECDAEAVQRKVAIRARVADPCPPRLECSVAWTSPLEAEELVETVLNLTTVQSLLVSQERQPPAVATDELQQEPLGTKRLAMANREQQQGSVTKVHAHDAEKSTAQSELHKKLVQLMQQELKYFQSRVNYVRQHEAEACGKLVNFVNDLNPKYARVYEAAGHLVKSQRGYRAFIALEERIFGRINSCSRGSKPAQPTSDVVQLLHSSSIASVILDQIMQRVEATANKLASALAEQHEALHGWVEDADIFGTLPYGGVQWRVAPLKRVARVVEKLALDRTQRRALETADPSRLDASNILDMARGMFTCATMGHALALLHALKLVADSGGRRGSSVARNSDLGEGIDAALHGWHFEVVRSKNRFARPTIGGWMDCLVNVRLVLDRDQSLDAQQRHSNEASDSRLHACAEGVVCEIQIVHRQLLTIRTEMGAHHSYGTYRSACELLQVVEKEALLGDEMEVKATLVNEVLSAIFVDDEGRAARLPTNMQHQSSVVNGCTWGLATAPPEFAWPRLLGLELPATVVALRKELLCCANGIAARDVRIPREGSLAESILAAGIDGISSGVLSTSTLRKITAGLEACKRSINSRSGADNLVVEVWGSAVHSSDFSRGTREQGTPALTYAPNVSPHFHGIDSDGVVERVVSATERLDGTCAITSICAVPNQAVHEASVVVGYGDGMIREWALDDRRCLKAFFVERAESISTSRAISSLAVTSSGDLLISCTRSCCVRIWSLATTALVNTLPTVGWRETQSATRDCAAVACIAFGGRQIVTFTGDEVARVWSLPEGRLMRSIPVVGGGPKETDVRGGRASGYSVGADIAASVSNDSTLVVTGGRDTVVRVWDLSTGALQQELRGHLKAVTSVAFSADGDIVASGSVDKSARLWSLKGGTLLREFNGHDLGVTAVAFSPDDNWLLSACQDGNLHMWSNADGSLESVYRGHRGTVNALCAIQFAMNIDNSRQKPRFLESLTTSRAPRAVALVALTGSADGCVRRWDLNKGVRVHIFAGRGGSVTSLAAAPKGQRVVSGSADGCARVWSAVRTGTRTQRDLLTRSDLVLAGHRGEVTAVCVTSDGTCVVTGSRDNTARLWSMRTGAQLYVFEAHTGAVRAVDVSTNGEILATGSEDCTARLWALKAGEGTTSADKRRGSTDRILHTFKGHARRVLAVRFTPDCNQLVTASCVYISKLFFFSWRAQIGSPGILLLAGIIL